MGRQGSGNNSTLLVAAGLALALLALAAPIAQGHDFRSTTGTTIGYNKETDYFRGLLSPDVDNNCERRRVVKVVKVMPGGDPEIIGRDKSNGEGKWRVSEPDASGSYQAIVRRRVYKAPGHRHICLRGESEILVVTP